MKTTITKYNALNARISNGHSRPTPCISMMGKGQFRLNKSLLEMMGATIGEGVEFLRDGEEWYVAKAAANGLPLCMARNGAATFHSVILYDALSEAAEVPAGRFSVAKEAHTIDGQKCYAVLVGSAKVQAIKRQAA